jgi:hypothetical protein
MRAGAPRKVDIVAEGRGGGKVGQVAQGEVPGIAHQPLGRVGVHRALVSAKKLPVSNCACDLAGSKGRVCMRLTWLQ